MNVNQRLAMMRLRNSVEQVEPLKHIMTEHDLNIRIVLTCSCGWKHSEPRRQNALARASKLRGAQRQHLLDILSRHNRQE